MTSSHTTDTDDVGEAGECPASRGGGRGESAALSAALGGTAPDNSTGAWPTVREVDLTKKGGGLGTERAPRRTPERARKSAMVDAKMIAPTWLNRETDTSRRFSAHDENLAHARARCVQLRRWRRLLGGPPRDGRFLEAGDLTVRGAPSRDPLDSRPKEKPELEVSLGTSARCRPDSRATSPPDNHQPFPQLAELDRERP